MTRNRASLALVTLGLMAVLAIFLLTLIFHTSSPERSVAIFQNIGILFFSLFLLRLVLSDDRPTTGPIAASAKAVAWPLAVAALIWAGSIPTYFVSDDFGHLRSIAAPLKTIVWNNLVFGQAHTFLRPIGFLSLAMDYRWFHVWAPGFHLTCVLLHMASVAGLFFLCHELGLGTETSAIAAIFYAVLPINTEAIVWIACRFDQIATPAMLWSLVAYVRFRRTRQKRFFRFALLLFLIAVFSKESAYVLPLIVLLLEIMVMRPRRFVPLSMFFGFAAACFLYRWRVFGGIGGYHEASGASSVLHIHSTTFKGLLLRAPAEMLFGLNWIQPSARTTLLIAGTITLILFALLLFPIQKHRRLLWLAMGWILIAPIPAHSMVRVGADLGNSRELYFGSVGAALLPALLASNVDKRTSRMIFCGLLVVAFACGAWHNLATWRFDAAMSRRIPADITVLYPHPVPGTEFVVDELPRSLRGIYFFQTGLDGAVKIAYGRNDVSAIRASELQRISIPGTLFVNVCWSAGENDNGSVVPCPAIPSTRSH